MAKGGRQNDPHCLLREGQTKRRQYTEMTKGRKDWEPKEKKNRKCGDNEGKKEAKETEGQEKKREVK